MKAALVTRSVFVCYLFHPRPSSSPELGRYPFAAADAADADAADDDNADYDDGDDEHNLWNQHINVILNLDDSSLLLIIIINDL